MIQESISLKKARAVIMSSQKLIGPTLTPLEIIQHLGYVQIDTISVVERAHHHVFWSRNPKYRPSDLEELVKSRKVFEYWSHAASYLPMSEYRYTLPKKKAFQKGENTWFPRDAKLMTAIVKRIRNEGALRSKDFENTKKGNTGWWDWKPSKKALEQLFFEGRLEVSRRDGFQKVYDLPERVIPSSIDTSTPSNAEFSQYLIERTLRHHGLATLCEIAYMQKRDVKTKVAKEIDNMLEDEKIIQIKVENNDNIYFARPQSLDNISKSNSRISILSPFDNLVIQRKKLDTIFDFDYQIECYVPSAKRKYGYFSLPIFQGSQAVARIDCKAHRSESKFRVNSIHYEKGIDRKSLQLEGKLKPKLQAFAKFNNCKLDL
jgi:uncharacterized protein